ncbi:MAG TPA: hypothetical protein VNO14_00145 [Blastocatellia bacterium]|nr:hypothetical protein [Blastocatellia bacterium]
MKLALLLTIIIGGAVLLAYCLIERHINQRACITCGYRASVDATNDQCPRCGSAI